MIVWLFTYDMTVGPVAYAIVGEVSSTRLRNKTVSLSRASYNIFSVGFGVMMPYMLNPTAWNWVSSTLHQSLQRTDPDSDRGARSDSSGDQSA